MDEKDEELAKIETINKIKEFIDSLGKEVQKDQEHNIIYKLSKMNVLLNFDKFCRDYDEHIKVLNKYIQDNKWKRYERGDE